MQTHQGPGLNLQCGTYHEDKKKARNGKFWTSGSIDLGFGIKV